MPEYRVIITYTGDIVYTIEADDEEAARDEAAMELEFDIEGIDSYHMDVEEIAE